MSEQPSEAGIRHPVGSQPSLSWHVRGQGNSWSWLRSWKAS